MELKTDVQVILVMDPLRSEIRLYYYYYLVESSIQILTKILSNSTTRKLK